MSRIRGEKLYPFLLSELQPLSTRTLLLAPLRLAANGTPNNFYTTACFLQ